MAFTPLCALLFLSGTPDLGQPVAEHTYYLGIEKALPNGTPDLLNTSNHWTQATDRFYVLVDTRTLPRDSDGKIHLPEMNMEFKSGGIPYKQQGKAPAGLGSEFHYVIGPSGHGSSHFTTPAHDVSPGNALLEFVVKTTTIETEVRLVNKRRVTRTQITDSYGMRDVGLAPHEIYDPVTERRSMR